jgi:predicted RNA binding protein YcfA (HicA-like mRNA interferase family)
MPKTQVLTSRQVIKLLEKEGFIFERSRGSHRIFYRAKDKRRAVVPYHGKDLPKGTLSAILKQAGIK